ncbi:extracellular solute-binding protein [Halorubrum sp. DTA46]|uniref:extracellular solute-binding protein n=1 Tax=Halorubrum sp. DTA46 TaxID=3402162 RepID=UPI003AAD9DFD
MANGSNRSRGVSLSNRRSFLGTVGAAGALALAGCSGLGGGDGADPFDDYGPQAAAVSASAVSWDDLGDLEGELTIYSGRTRDQIDPLFAAIEDEYDGFTINRDYDGNAEQLNKINEEGQGSPADIFYTQSGGALASLKQEDRVRTLPDDVVDAVSDTYSDPDGTWTGASGRVRSIQYNTDLWEGGAEALPADIMEYATDERFEGIISTRPNSGTFRSFIIAMIELEGEEATREWVRGMVDDQNATLYSSGGDQAQNVADGNQAVALGNNYYAARVLNNDPDTPLDLAFTDGDAGCLFNVSGVGILDSSDRPNLAAEFTRHVLAAEGQEFFVNTNGEYPVLDGVDYVGDLPSLSEINPPEFDLNALADVERAVDLLRDEGMTV